MFKKFTLLIILTITLLFGLMSCQKTIPEEAIVEYEKGLEYYNKDSHGDELTYRKMAIEHLEKAIEIEPMYPEAHSLLGLIYIHMTDNENAKIYLENAEIAGSKDPETYGLLGLIYSESYNIEKSLEYYNKAIDIDPKYYDAYFGIAMTYVRNNDNDNRDKYLVKGAKLGNKSCQSYCKEIGLKWRDE